MALTSLPTRERQSQPSDTVCLPGISDLLGGVPSVRPLAPICPGQRPVSFRSNSFPALPTVSRLYLQTSDASSTRSPPTQQILDFGGIQTAPKFSPSCDRSTPPNASVGCLSACSTNPGVDQDGELARLQGLLKWHDPDISAIMQCTSALLVDDVRPAYDQGWFQPTASGNEFSKRLEGKIVGKGMDELVRAFFFRDENRETYGERVSIPRKYFRQGAWSEDSSVQGEVDPEDLVKWKKREESTKAHQKVEKGRRDRHRDLQRQGCLRCCDISTECGCEHAKEVKDKEQIRSQGGKGPGKDEQLWTAIYQHELAGRVLQSVNDGRKRAEKTVELLLEFMVRQQNREWHLCSTGTKSSPSPNWNYVGRKRSCDQVDQDSQQAWTAVSTDTDSEGDRSRCNSSAGGSPWKRARGLSQNPALLSDGQKKPDCFCRRPH